MNGNAKTELDVVDVSPNCISGPGVLAAPDPFDPAKLRLPQDFAANIGVTKALVTIPVRKPDKSWFVRVHPGEAYRLQTAVVELKEDQETYLVKPELWPELATEATFGLRAVFTAVTRQGVIFLWPITLPGPDKRPNSWTDSALEAASMAEGSWVRVCANLQLGAYEFFRAEGALAPPVWPNLPFRELLSVAFKSKYIDSHDHPVLRRLRGAS